MLIHSACIYEECIMYKPGYIHSISLLTFFKRRKKNIKYRIIIRYIKVVSVYDCLKT